MEAGFVDGLHVGLLRADRAGEELLPDRVVHELHALTLSGDDHILELLGRALAHDGGHGVVDHEDFIHRHAPGAVRFFHQELGDNAAQGGGQHRADLRLLVAREDIDHAVHRLAGVVRVKGAEDQQARLGSGECERDGFEVTHFTDENDVRILAQRGFQAGRERLGVLGHFALGDDALFVPVNELDRLLDGDDVTGEVGIDVVDERREGGALTRSGGAGDEHDAAAHVAEGFDDLGNAEVLERFDLGGDDPEDRAVAVGLLEVVAAKPVVLVHFVGEIEVAAFLEPLPALGSANFAQHVAHFFLRERFLADRDNLAVSADFWRLSLGEVQIGSAAVDENLKKLVDVGHVSCIR